VIIATAGHVDHGKTLLVHALTGIETDRLEEEQQRGLTIDLGFAYISNADQRLGFIDVPGHIRFIHNMLAGIAAVDYALLVVAADDGPMPQTIEHLAILNLLGIKRGVVALTKIDRVSSDRIAEVTGAIRKMLENTTLKDASIFPVSAATGEGVETLSGELWRQAARTQARSSEGEFRLAVDRRFTMKGSGIVVTGSVFSGSISVGDEARLLPDGMPLRIRGIRRQDQDAASSHAGDRCALNITAQGLALEKIKRGQWVTTSTIVPTDRIDAQITVLPDARRPLRNWTPIHIHSAASHLTGRLATLSSSSIAPGESGLVQLVLSEPGIFWSGDRIIIREQSAESTLGGGHVIDPFGPRRGRARPDRIALLEAMQSGDAIGRLTALVTVGNPGVNLADFAITNGLSRQEVEEFVPGLKVIRCGEDYIVAQSRFESIRQATLDALADWLSSNTGSQGATERQLRHALTDHSLQEPVFNGVLDSLVEDRLLVRTGSRYAIPGHQAEMTPAEQNFWTRVEPLLTENLTRPPVMHDIAKQTGLPAGAVEKLLGRYVELGLLERPASNRFFIPEGIRVLAASAVEAAKGASGEFTVKEFRDLTGIGRNLCIEILEYFDRRGVTVRIGDKRKLGTNAPAELK
jgi:selenocysteine-specific elongation factor